MSQKIQCDLRQFAAVILRCFPHLFTCSTLYTMLSQFRHMFAAWAALLGFTNPPHSRCPVLQLTCLFPTLAQSPKMSGKSSGSIIILTNLTHLQGPNNIARRSTRSSTNTVEPTPAVPQPSVPQPSAASQPGFQPPVVPQTSRGKKRGTGSRGRGSGQRGGSQSSRSKVRPFFFVIHCLLTDIL